MRRALTLLAALLALAPAAFAQERAPAPNRVIYPGETISHGALGDVALKRGAVLGADIAAAPNELVGKVARRTLLPGRVVPLSALREAFLVKGGSPAQVRFEANGLTIVTTALPLQDGAVGDMIRVRNIESGATFTGIVLGDGTIMVGAS
jgi:flagella basal body P-ring formation protein FlgA